MGYFLLLLLVAKSIADCCIICLGSSSLKKDLNSSSFHWCYSQSLQNSFRAKSPRPSKEIKRQTEHLLLSLCESTRLFGGWYQALNVLAAVFTQENTWKMHIKSFQPTTTEHRKVSSRWRATRLPKSSTVETELQTAKFHAWLDCASALRAETISVLFTHEMKSTEV